MKSALKLTLSALLIVSIMSFTCKQKNNWPEITSFSGSIERVKVASDPTVPPYVWAIPWYYSQVDVWVRWTPDVVLSRDYYADVIVSFNDDCGTAKTKTVRVIIPKGTWTAWLNFDTCFHPYVTGYSLISWGPL